MDEKTMIEQIFKFIRKDENYIPRNYQTIGGGWTVDSWKYNDITVQLTDEGYGKKIITNNLNVYYCNNISYYKGNVNDLTNLYNNLVKGE